MDMSEDGREKPKRVEAEVVVAGRNALGKFAPGNAGKTRGTTSVYKREMAEWAREQFWEFAPAFIEALFSDQGRTVRNAKSLELAKLRFEVMDRLLSARGWGRVPAVVKLDGDADSPMAILLEMARRRSLGQDEIPDYDEEQDDEQGGEG